MGIGSQRTRATLVIGMRSEACRVLDPSATGHLREHRGDANDSLVESARSLRRDNDTEDALEAGGTAATPVVASVLGECTWERAHGCALARSS